MTNTYFRFVRTRPDILIVVGSAILLVVMAVIGADPNKPTNQEISEIQRYLDEGGNPQDIEADDLRSQSAKEYLEKAIEDYEEQVGNAPAPKIHLITPYTLEGTDYVIDAGSEGTELTIEFTLEDGDTAVIDKWRVDEDETLIADADGVFKVVVSLQEQESRHTVTASNKYNWEYFEIIVRREETASERESRLALEQKAAEWTQSEAGQICSRHPDWEQYDCTRVANGNIWIGMTYEMLVEGWGKPNSANPSNYGSGTRWQWCWNDLTPSCFYDDNDDGFIDSYN